MKVSILSGDVVAQRSTRQLRSVDDIAKPTAPVLQELLKRVYLLFVSHFNPVD